MFCKSCHYGSENLIIADPNNFACPQCKKTGFQDKNPYNEIAQRDRRTLKDTRKDRAQKLAEHDNHDDFNFNEKDIQTPVIIR